jgi:hypothetical protein
MTLTSVEILESVAFFIFFHDLYQCRDARKLSLVLFILLP